MKMKRQSVLITFLLVFMLLLTPLSALASDVSDAAWTGDIRITNSGSDAASAISVNCSINGTALIANGYANATLSDIAFLYASTDYAIMPGVGSNPWMLFVDSVAGNQNINYDFYTGGATGGKLRWFPGTGGGTTSDFNIGTDNLSMEWKGRFDPAVTGYISYKNDAYTVKGNGDGTVTANISLMTTQMRIRMTAPGAGTYYIQEVDFWDGSSWVSPTGASGTSWTNPTYVYDGSTVTDGAKYTFGGAGTSEYLYATHAGIADVSKIRVYSSNAPTTEIDVLTDGTWYNVCNENFADAAWVEFENTAVTPSITTDAISAGEHTFTLSQDDICVALGIDATDDPISDPITFVTDNLVLNAPLWQTECSAASFTTIDGNAIAATANATWTSQGYSFAGNSNIDFGSPAELDLTNISVCIWIDNAAINTRLVHKQADGAGYLSFAIQVGTANNGAWAVSLGTGTMDAVKITVNIGDGEPHFVVGTFDGTTRKVYVDGVDVTGSATTLSNSAPNNIYLGQKTDGTQRYTGTVGELQIYSVALSADDVLRNYNATKSKYTTSDIYTYSTLASVPDNANDITDCTNYVMSYVEYIKRWVGGALVHLIEWEYDTTFTDQSGESNDMTPTFRTTSSDADVSAALINFAPVTTSEVSTFTLSSSYSILTGAVSTPGNMFSDGDYSKLPAGPVNDMLDAAAVPRAAWWFPFLFLGICVVGLIIYGATSTTRGVNGRLAEGQIDGSLLIMFVVMEALLFVLGKMGPIPEWPYYLFPIPAIAIIMSKKHFSWGVIVK